LSAGAAAVARWQRRGQRATLGRLPGGVPGLCTVRATSYPKGVVEASGEREQRLAERAQQEATLDELRRLLRGVPVHLIGMYLAERLGCGPTGGFTIELRVEEGGLRRAWIRALRDAKAPRSRPATHAPRASPERRTASNRFLDRPPERAPSMTGHKARIRGRCIS
jgi:hypothetical protein